MLPKRIVVIGASVVAGVMDPEGQGYVGRLQRWHESLHHRNVVFNLGIGGDTSTRILRRFINEVTVRKPDLILLGAGVNDARRIGGENADPTTPLNQYAENIQALLLQSKGLAPIVWVSTPPFDETKTTPLSKWNEQYYIYKDDVDQYIATAERICRESDVPYIDLYASLSENPDWIRYLSDDGLHPGPHGYELIYQIVRRFLEDMYPEPSE